MNSFKDQYPTDSSLWNMWWEAGLVCIRIYLSAVVPGRKLREIETTAAGKVPLKSGKWPTRRLIARDNSILQLCFSPINPFDLTCTGLFILNLTFTGLFILSVNNFITLTITLHILHLVFWANFCLPGAGWVGRRGFQPEKHSWIILLSLLLLLHIVINIIIVIIVIIRGSQPETHC